MNKFTSHIMQNVVILVFMLCPASMWATAGDVNGDGVVTSSDVTAIYNYLLNNDQTFVTTSDVDGDGAITVADITFIYNILLGGTPVIDNEDELFARCYATLRSEEPINGFEQSITSFLRTMWQLNTLTTDEAYCLWFDPGINEMNTNSWGSDLPHAAGLFYRLCANIDVCNAYLANSAKHDDAHNGEIRTLRALYHYYLMDLFGNVPYNTSASVQTLMATQVPRSTVYANLLNELKACENLLVEPRTNTYGRIDKAAAWMLIARISLNQQVYATSSSTAVVNDALTQAKQYSIKVINSNYGCVSGSGTPFNGYQSLFLGDNNSNGAAMEIIWPIVYSSGDNDDWAWSGTTFLVAAPASWNYNSTYPNGINGQWTGIIARPEFASQFGVNTSDNLSGNLTTFAASKGDYRALFFSTGQPQAAITDSITFDNGFGYLKYLNMNKNGSNPNTTFAGTDFPLMRYPEAMLTYAEADARLNGGACSTLALNVLNFIEERAGAASLSSANLETIANLWSKEFGFEGRRRIDLVRFAKYGTTYGNTGTYQWSQKGGTSEGRDFDQTKNVFAIPVQARQDNSNLAQNPGYDISYPEFQLTITSFTPVLPDGTPIGETSYSIYWDAVTSTSNIINPEYEVRIAGDAQMSNYTTYVTTETTWTGLDKTEMLKIARKYGTSNLYFQVYTNASGTGKAFSNVANVDFGFDLTIQPYWLVGDCVGDGLWTNDSDPYNSSMVPMLPNEDGYLVYAGYFPAGGQFMIVTKPGSWQGVIYGGDEYGDHKWSGENGYPEGEGNHNITINQAGYYQLQVNIYTHELYIYFMGSQPVYGAMGVLGDFNNWSLDEEMGMLSYDYDNHNHDWNATVYINSDSGVKFRANYGWTDNWGGSTFPGGVAVRNGANIPATAGIYKVYFNDITGCYLFTPTTSQY